MLPATEIREVVMKSHRFAEHTVMMGDLSENCLVYDEQMEAEAVDCFLKEFDIEREEEKKW